MTWYAIRTHPGAQMPQREYAVESTGSKRGKGYRIVPSLNPRVSAVERALSDAGVSAYMPAEYQAVRSRKKTALYTIRRFAMFPGYVFVHDVTDFEMLRNLPGVADVVKVNGVPMPIFGNDEMITLMTEEGKSEMSAQDQIDHWMKRDREAERKAATKKLAAARRRISTGQRVKVLWGKRAGSFGTVAGWEREGIVSVIAERLGQADLVSVPYEELELLSSAA